MPGVQYDLYDRFQAACLQNHPAGEDFSGGGATGPVIGRSPSILNPVAVEGQNAPGGSFTVTNAGIDTLQYTISDDASWLDVSPSVGTSTGEIDTITVTMLDQEANLADAPQSPGKRYPGMRERQVDSRGTALDNRVSTELDTMFTGHGLAPRAGVDSSQNPRRPTQPCR